ncbi:MAG: TRAP transporter substrate-binding protein [Lachnospiraceae bacterium]
MRNQNRIKIFYMVMLLVCGGILLMGCEKRKEEALLFTASESEASEEERTLIYLTHSESADSFTNQAAQEFKRALEEISAGSFDVEIYPEDTLGSVKEADYMLEGNAVQMRIGSGPSKAIVLLGYPVLTGMEIPQLEEALQGDALQNFLAEECREYGVQIIGMLPSMYRVLTSNQPVETADDFRDFRMRISDYILSETWWSGLGADTVKVPLSEVYVAMQQNLFDGNPEGTLLSVISNGFYQQQKYIIDIRSQIYLEPVYISSEFMESLDAEQQEQIQFAIAQMEENSREQLEIEKKKAEEILDRAGVEWITLSEEVKQSMQETAGAEMEKCLREYAGDVLVDQLLNVLQKK